MDTALSMDFVESQAYIERIARGFVRRFGGDLDELLSISNELFIEIHNGFPEDRSWFPWLHGCLWNRWLDYTRHRLAKCRATDDSLALEFATAPVALAPYTTQALTDDAWLVAAVALNPPASLVAEATGRGGTPTNFRSCIRTHFTGLGWDRDRVQAAFDEIGDSLVR